jgi:hypothetical protein
VGEKLENQAHRPAFEIIFVYCEAEGSLDIYAPKNGRAISDLQTLFARHILKLDNLSEWKKDQRVYDLNCILEHGFEFKIEPKTGISKVLITSLRVTLQQDRRQRVVVEADPFIVLTAEILLMGSLPRLGNIVLQASATYHLHGPLIH